MKTINIRVPIYDDNVRVCIGNINKIHKKYKPNIILPCAAFHQSYNDMELIALPKNWEPYLAHEAGHCAWQILRNIGSPINDSTEEIVRYLQDWLIKEIKQKLIWN